MHYSSTVFGFLVGTWAVGSLVFAWFARRRLHAYLGSVILSAPAIAYSMVGYGLLELGGILHALSAGLYALPFHYFFQRIRLQPRMTAKGLQATAAAPSVLIET
jgi:hypothetical protein